MRRQFNRKASTGALWVFPPVVELRWGPASAYWWEQPVLFPPAVTSDDAAAVNNNNTQEGKHTLACACVESSCLFTARRLGGFSTSARPEAAGGARH